MEDFLTSEERQIEICEVDYMGQYQLCHLLNRFSEIATISAKNIGMWSEEMMKTIWMGCSETKSPFRSAYLL